MKPILYSAALGLGLSACNPLAPSKIYGDWELEYLSGLEQAYKAQEEKFTDRGRTLLWDTAHPHRVLGVTYSFNFLTNETGITWHACNLMTSHYSGAIRTSLKDITFKSAEPPQARGCTSCVKDASDEVSPSGPAPIDIQIATFLTVSRSRDDLEFRLSENNQILIFEDANQTELARFKRKEAAE